MGYRVIPKARLRGPQFKIDFVATQSGVKKHTALPKDKWLSVGFRPDMTLDEARERARQINAHAELMRQEKRRTAISERLSTEKLEQSAFMPPLLVAEFEARLFSRDSQPRKLATMWNVTRRYLTEIKVEPHEWAERPELFYDLFSRRQISFNYARGLLALMNKWGAFVCRRQGRYFEEVSVPTGREKARIAKAHRSRGYRTGNRPSAPLTPELLESKRSALDPEHYRWLYLSVWFGLRPSEIDRLAEPPGPRTWSITEEDDGTPVLWVFQEKIEESGAQSVTKPIPCVRPEQLEALTMAQAGGFRRPLSKTLVARFGPQFTLYAGRKGFTDLLLRLGQSLEDISVWLGHTSIDVTWRHYKNRQRVSWKKTG